MGASVESQSSGLESQLKVSYVISGESLSLSVCICEMGIILTSHTCLWGRSVEIKHTRSS